MQEALPAQPTQLVVHDYSLWLTELLNLLYHERCNLLAIYLTIVMREDEDRRRRENMMLEEERLRREKEELDHRYKNELHDRQRAYEGITSL